MKNSTLIEKPWGSEELIEANERYVLKKLTMLAGHRCSLQFHNRKCETIYVLSGKLNINFGDNKSQLNVKEFIADEYITLIPGVVHRMEAVEDSIYLEASTPELEDVVRISDDYKRA